MNREKLTLMLVEHEDLRLKPYKDSVGKLTIGIGRNLDDRGITRDEAFYLCANNIKEVEDDLDRDFPWWRQLDEVRQLVLADMCFNMGITVLSGFKRTLTAIQEHRFKDAARFMLESKWAEQVGRRAERLAEMMRTGEEQPQG